MLLLKHLLKSTTPKAPSWHFVLHWYLHYYHSYALLWKSALKRNDELMKIYYGYPY